MKESAVKAIDVANDSLKVYNLQGVSVYEGSDKNALNSPPAGIYVVNGKKVVIAK